MTFMQNVAYHGLENGFDQKVFIVDNSCLKSGFITAIPAKKQTEFADNAAAISKRTKEIESAPEYQPA